MTKREYAEEIANIIGGEVTEVEKANGIIMTGILKRFEGSNISPTVYIDADYAEGKSIDEAAQRVSDIIEANKQANFDVNMLTDYSKAKPLLKARLYNKKTTAEVKRSARSYGFSDLIITPYIDLNDYMPGATTKITKQLIEHWGITERTVIDTAIKNTAGDIEIKSMREIMREMMGLEDEMFEAMVPEDAGMYVISNKRRMFGAIGAISVKEKLQEMFPQGYAILPSSVHEIIAIPLAEGSTEEDLSQMVHEVNTTQVAPEEVLSGHAYIFKGVAA